MFIGSCGSYCLNITIKEGRSGSKPDQAWEPRLSRAGAPIVQLHGLALKNVRGLQGMEWFPHHCYVKKKRLMQYHIV